MQYFKLYSGSHRDEKADLVVKHLRKLPGALNRFAAGEDLTPGLEEAAIAYVQFVKEFLEYELILQEELVQMLEKSHLNS